MEKLASPEKSEAIDAVYKFLGDVSGEVEGCRGVVISIRGGDLSVHMLNMSFIEAYLAVRQVYQEAHETLEATISKHDQPEH